MQIGDEPAARRGPGQQRDHPRERQAGGDAEAEDGAVALVVFDEHQPELPGLGQDAGEQADDAVGQAKGGQGFDRLWHARHTAVEELPAEFLHQRGQHQGEHEAGQLGVGHLNEPEKMDL